MKISLTSWTYRVEVRGGGHTHSTSRPYSQKRVIAMSRNETGGRGHAVEAHGDDVVDVQLVVVLLSCIDEDQINSLDNPEALREWARERR